MLPPEEFEDGFNIKSVVGAVFVGVVMMPAQIYMGLMVGQGQIGQAAQWVTVILFLEIARRTLATMSRPEIFVLMYMCGAALAAPFSGLLWNQFLVQSESAHAYGISSQIPVWIAPAAEICKLRTFFHPAWFPALGYIILTQLIWRIDRFGLGYVLFRLTSDGERLPFPMAPVGAMGATALAESSAGKETWRWRTFSIGAMIGMAFAVIYIVIPQVSNIIWGQRIDILPIPFVDLTTNAEKMGLKAVPMTISLDLQHLFIGMVLPFWAVVGTFVGWLGTAIANPFLVKHDILTSWTSGMGGIQTAYMNNIDFYLSLGIGLATAVALIGFYHLFASLRRQKSQREDMDIGQERSLWERVLHPPKARGDIPLWVGIAIYLFSTLSYITICWWLVPEFPTWILFVYGFLYMPFMAYAGVRLMGIAGQFTAIPMVREAAFILSGYRGVKIWFAPIPVSPGGYGVQAQWFRTVELTGTKLTSIIKAEFIIFPIVMVTSILYAQLIWRLAPVPGPAYPFAEKMWEYQAMMNCVVWSSTLGEFTPFYDALKTWVIVGGVGLGLATYSTLAYFGLPVMFMYGVVRGLSQGLPYVIITQLIGALIGRYYFRKKYGLKWRQYAPVLLAGFMCGFGLLAMLVLSMVFISKAVFQLPY